MMTRILLATAFAAGSLLVTACSDETVTSPESQMTALDQFQSVIYDPTDPDLITDQGTCADIGDGTGESGASGKIEGGWDDGDEALTISAPDGYLIYMYCVKAGSETSGGGVEIIEVEPPLETVTIDHPDVNSVSHYVAFFIEDETASAEWCSPGFWKNNPLRVAQTDVEMTALYLEVIGGDLSLSPKAVRDGASPNPSLQEVLDNPNWYGGEAANNVADLLSDAHDDVDYSLGDERVEDSCPLSADASGWND